MQKNNFSQENGIGAVILMNSLTECIMEKQVNKY